MESIRLIIITVPPPAAAEELDRLRRQVCRISGSRAALSYPPHVTLRTGVIVPPGCMDGFIEGFGKVVGAWRPFPIRTDGLFHFPYTDGADRKLVFGFRIRLDPPLAGLNRRLLSYTKFRKSRKRAFHPHLTLAFDDLALEGLEAAQAALSTSGMHPQSMSWPLDNVSLYRLEGARWRPFHVYRQSAASRS